MVAKARNGYVAILSVLVMGAAALAVSLALLTSGTDAQQSALAIQQSVSARALARACAEEALQEIHDNVNYIGTDSYVASGGDCVVTVTSTGATTRSLLSTGNSGDVVRKIQVYVTIGISSISITSWKEIS